MNGIIHNCAKAFDPEKEGGQRTEEEIFVAIFAYIQTLFEIIKPQKLFFLAVDGVAPRAKINQQRARRFRAAKEAEEEAAKEAKRMASKGLKRSENAEPKFDGNCITPGTEFMDRMARHIKYFLAQRISEEPSWQNIEVIFSGPDVPGEGEHKIMEYIRSSKAQPGYNPTLRHCLYGLDADLILLGLLSHEPHFALLREEVLFGPASRKARTLAQTKFFLLFLGLLRDYVDEEFRAGYQASVLGMEETDVAVENVSHAAIPFPNYNLERIIDDFILMTLFVGNDFLPGLPFMHINENAIGFMFDAYKKIYLSSGGQYMNHAGTINWGLLSSFLNELTFLEKEQFQKSGHALLRHPKGKTISETQARLYQLVRHDLLLNEKVDSLAQPPGLSIHAKDKKFLWQLAHDFGLQFKLSEDHHFTLMKGWDPDDSFEEASQEYRIPENMLEKYDAMRTEEQAAHPDVEENLEGAFTDWKRQMYREKLHMDFRRNPKALEPLLQAYATGIQWNMYYYYRGVVDWAWFYPYHYGPYMSDVAEFIETFDCPEFVMGKPYAPLEQLLSVLPAASCAHVPVPMAELMTDAHSPIIDFYPLDFATDANGKKAPWEAVVLIPFVDEERLLMAMESVMGSLKPDELERNRFGTTVLLKYSPVPSELSPPPRSRYAAILGCHCSVLDYDLPIMDVDHPFKPELCHGVGPVAGFPTLKNVAHRAHLENVEIAIFGGKPTGGKSLVLTIDESSSRYGGSRGETVEGLAKKLVGQRVFYSWPFIVEGRVERLTDALFTYRKESKAPHSDSERKEHEKAAQKLHEDYLHLRAIILGDLEVVVWVAPLLGLCQDESGGLGKKFAQSSLAEPQPLHTVLALEDCLEDPRTKVKAALRPEEEYPVGSACVYLGNSDSHGALARVVGHLPKRFVQIEVERRLPLSPEPTFPSRLARKALDQQAFYPAKAVALRLGLDQSLLNRISSAFYLFFGDDMDRSSNIGLGLKFENRGLRIDGYARHGSFGWEYSEKAIALLGDYKATFPTLFQRLHKVKIGSKVQVSEIFGNGVTTEKELGEALKPIKSWLKERHLGLQEIPSDTMMLPAEGVAAIHAAWQAYEKDHQGTRWIRLQVPMADLRHEGMARFVAPASAAGERGPSFRLGDRVRYIGSGSSGLPFGRTAIIIGLDGPSAGSDLMTHLLLDAPLMMGAGSGTLGGRCPPNHGISVPRRYVLNLTHHPAMGPAVEQGMQHMKIREPTKQPSSVRPPTFVKAIGDPTKHVRPSHPSAAEIPQNLAALFQAHAAQQVVHPGTIVQRSLRKAADPRPPVPRGAVQPVGRQAGPINPVPVFRTRRSSSTTVSGPPPAQPISVAPLPSRIVAGKPLAAPQSAAAPQPSISLPPSFTTIKRQQQHQKLLKPNLTWSGQ